MRRELSETAGATFMGGLIGQPACKRQRVESHTGTTGLA